MSDSLRERLNGILNDEHYHIGDRDRALDRIESEINQSRHTDAEIVRSFSGWDDSGTWKQVLCEQLTEVIAKKIESQLSSVQQEAPKGRMLTHRYSAAGCIACDLTESEHVDGTQIPDPRAAAPTEQEAPPKTCKICGGVDTIERRDDDTAAPTDISGERHEPTFQDACPHRNIRMGGAKGQWACAFCGKAFLPLAAPQQTTAAQRGEK